MKNQLFNLLITMLITSSIGLATLSAEAQCRANVSWAGLSGATASGTTLNFAGSGNCWCNGGYDLSHPVGPGGYVQFQPGQQNTYKMLGLNSDPTADHSYASIDYAWYPYNGGGSNIYENGAGYGITSEVYSPSDVYKVYWNPFNNKIEYYINDILYYTSGVTPSATLYVDASLYTAGASFTNVVVAGGDCQTCASPVEWTSASGVAVQGDVVTNVGAANSWSNGAYSVQPVGPGGFVAFQAGEQNTYKMIGLNSDPATDHSYCSIDYAWYPYNGGGYQVYENCGNPYGNGTAYSPSDRWMIYWNPANNRIEYYRNKVLQYTSANIPSGKYYVDISLYTSGASFYNVVIQGGNCSYTKDWF